MSSASGANVVISASISPAADADAYRATASEELMPASTVNPTVRPFEIPAYGEVPSGRCPRRGATAHLSRR